MMSVRGAVAVVGICAVVVSPAFAQNQDLASRDAAAGLFGLPTVSSRMDRGEPRLFTLECADPDSEASPPDGAGACLTPERHRPIGAGSWIRMQVTPVFARVYINGTYAGTAEQFTPPYRGLRIGLGPQLIELRAPGYRNQSFWMMQGPDRISLLSRSLQRN